jgi:hypothetical protein
MDQELLPSWRKIVDIVFVSSSAALCIRYLLVVERIPNYQHILTWFIDWWH